eukprot:6197739-Pleurochrysis_carterae.AAC.3
MRSTCLATSQRKAWQSPTSPPKNTHRERGSNDRKLLLPSRLPSIPRRRRWIRWSRVACRADGSRVPTPRATRSLLGSKISIDDWRSSRSDLPHMVDVSALARDWVKRGTLSSYWLPGLFFPQVARRLLAAYSLGKSASFALSHSELSLSCSGSRSVAATAARARSFK